MIISVFINKIYLEGYSAKLLEYLIDVCGYS